MDAPAEINPGDTVTLTSRVSNENNDAVSAVVEFEFGSATQLSTVTVPANGSTTATVSFTPGEATDFPYDVSVTSVSRA